MGQYSEEDYTFMQQAPLAGCGERIPEAVEKILGLEADLKEELIKQIEVRHAIGKVINPIKNKKIVSL